MAVIIIVHGRRQAYMRDRRAIDVEFRGSRRVLCSQVIIVSEPDISIEVEHACAIVQLQSVAHACTRASQIIG